MKKVEKKTAESRSEPRNVQDQYNSVEFSISKQYPVFQFRIRDISPSGMGILLKSGSKALDYLKVGLVLDMKYNPKDSNGSSDKMKTEIRHITYLEDGRYRGQYLVGLLLKTGSGCRGRL
ncbi:MAG: hypothetical protein B6240_09445 [Desulfobacteraceae bacterium 4572_87]|nr:MAG: hypothetical protein B6240_09445 [Desulfobacteraceae bacterium 4572_87]